MQLASVVGELANCPLKWSTLDICMVHLPALSDYAVTLYMLISCYIGRLTYKQSAALILKLLWYQDCWHTDLVG